MKERLRQAVRLLAARRTAWRRERNFAANRRGAARLHWRIPVPTRGHWAALAGAMLALGGAAVIAAHARQLGRAAGTASQAAVIFQPVMPGTRFSVPVRPGITLHDTRAGTFLVAAGMHPAPPVRIDLCRKMADPATGRLMPLRIGYRFGDVVRLAAHAGQHAGPVALAAPDTAGMPRVVVTGSVNGAALSVRWKDGDGSASWVSDAGRGVTGSAGKGSLGREGWLTWSGNAALRIQRRPAGTCPAAGELVLQVYRAGGGPVSRAHVLAFAGGAAPVTAWMAPGAYEVPAAPPAGLEDQALFRALDERGLVRLTPAGLAELAPRDLAAWQAAGAGERAAELAGWGHVKLDAEAQALLARLYGMADGAFVREQVRVFNSERRLLAWRVRPQEADGDWQASAGSAPATTASAMPLAASRLFAELPQGWGPWSRIAAWPTGAGTAEMSLVLPHAAAAGDTLRLMVAGRIMRMEGARTIAGPAAACSGRACPSPDAVQVVELALEPGARRLTIEAAPLDMAALAAPADQRYRHLRVEQGRLAWHALPAHQPAARAGQRAAVRLTDRHGALLWSGGEPTPEASAAGLAPLLGIRADHANSVAGMLARLPAPGGTLHEARLSLDLTLQAASHRVLDCLGMRRGTWDGTRCHGGTAPPRGREAGVVVLDAETGDVLAAAGSGAATVSAANWDEVRNFDRTNPARSPLRLPAFQHDGGAHRSPGSTFKIVSALGLEQAARRDPKIDALLAGLPLGAINELAAWKGFAFRTAAPSYPVNTRLAHITNFRGQHLDRRARDGRFGLSEALAYSVNTWFAWSGELADRSLFGRPDGGAPDLHPLEPGALDTVRPIVGMARRLGFEQAWRLDGGLLPGDFAWSQWDALQASAARIDPVHTRHELRQMAIGLRMQATPLQMALVSAAVGQGALAPPRLLLELDGREAAPGAAVPVGVRLDRIRAGMKGVIDSGTASSLFRSESMAGLRRGLSGKTGTAPTANGLSTVWFTGWLEPGSLPGQDRRLAVAAFVSHSDATGGEHAAPIAAAVLGSLAGQRK